MNTGGAAFPRPYAGTEGMTLSQTGSLGKYGLIEAVSYGLTAPHRNFLR